MSQSMGDKDPMPFGQHKDKPLEKVPASYLIWLRDWVNVCEMVVEAWGTHGAFNDQGRVIHDAIMDNFPEANRKLRYLGLTAWGHPKHPLYLRADTKPMEWSDGRLPGTGSAIGSAVENTADVGFGGAHTDSRIDHVARAHSRRPSSGEIWTAGS